MATGTSSISGRRAQVNPANRQIYISRFAVCALRLKSCRWASNLYYSESHCGSKRATLVRPVLEYASCLWCTGCTDDMRKLERVQRRWTKQIEGLEDSSYAERLKELDLYSVQGRFLRANLIEYWKKIHGKSTISPEDIFHQPPRRGMRGHCFKLFVCRAVCSVRQRSFSHRRVSIWNSLYQRM